MYLTLEERETIIHYSEASDEATVYTCSPALMRKMDKLCEAAPNEFKLTKQDELSRWYSCSKKRIAINRKKQISEETKQRLAETLRNARV